MHWTLIAFCALTCVTFAGGWVQWRTVRSVPLGLWVCAAWAVQQGHWLVIGGDSAILFAIGDVVIVAKAWRLRAMWQAQAIIGLTMLSVAGPFINDPAAGWWWSTYCVLASMLIGLPRLEWAVRRGPDRRINYEGA